MATALKAHLRNIIRQAIHVSEMRDATVIAGIIREWLRLNLQRVERCETDRWSYLIVNSLRCIPVQSGPTRLRNKEDLICCIVDLIEADHDLRIAETILCRASIKDDDPEIEIADDELEFDDDVVLPKTAVAA